MGECKTRVTGAFRKFDYVKGLRKLKQTKLIPFIIKIVSDGKA